MLWLRTCQECNHKQKDTKPVYGTEPTDAYCNRKCRKCKSEALDYGMEYNDDGTKLNTLNEDDYEV